MQKTKIVLTLMVLFTLVGFGFPSRIGYQGKITDPSGVAINDTVEIGFSIWNSVAGGDSLWGEMDTVRVIKGLFDAVLGDRIPMTVDFSGTVERWVQLIVEGEALSPRQPINSVPTALYANYADSLVGGIIVDHNDLGGLQGGDALAGEFFHLDFDQYRDLHAPGSDNQNIFESVSDGSATYTASSEHDGIIFAGSGGATVTLDDVTGIITIDASSAGDNWGGQVVESGLTIDGDGTAASPLDVNWGSVTQHTDVTDAGSGQIITGAERTQISTNATNIGDLTYTEDNYVTDGEPLTASIDALDMEVADIVGGTSNAYIQNQDASAQSANFWITGNATIEGDLTVGNIVGQGSSHGSVTPVVSINSTSAPVTLAEVTYSSGGPGSEIQLSFAGTFDDRGGQDGAYVNVELVRDPGMPGETTISQVSVSIYSSTVHQFQNVSINGCDTPSEGTHTYAVRAVVAKEPYTSGRCINGVLQLAEIKE